MLVLGLVLGWGWVNVLIRPRLAQGEEEGDADDEDPHGEAPLATLTIEERSYYHIKYDISLIMVKNGILLSIIFASKHVKLRIIMIFWNLLSRIKKDKTCFIFPFISTQLWVIMWDL